MSGRIRRGGERTRRGDGGPVLRALPLRAQPAGCVQRDEHDGGTRQ